MQPQPPHEITRVEFRGFGPNTFAYHNWQVYYKWTRGLHNGVDLVVPELQRRGSFRTEYEARTLRGNRGLARPASRYDPAAQALPQSHVA